MKLEVVNLHVSVEKKEILKGVSFEIASDEVCVLLGPNGAGKSTLSNVLMGHPKYVVTKGKIFLDGVDITFLSTDERAKRGLFLSFQAPVEISGVTLLNFLRTAYNALRNTHLRIGEFHELLREKMQFLGMDFKFRIRSVNKGFSGGERKRVEILQLMLFEPDFAILDEIDSGLDVDALKKVTKGINLVKRQNHTGFLLITHYNKIFDYLKPDKVIVLKAGIIVERGGFELAKRIEREGFNRHK